MHTLIYVLRGAATGLIIYFIVTWITGFPGFSIAIVYGLWMTTPFANKRYFLESLSLLLSITSIHFLHTIVFSFYNGYVEFGVVITSWIILFWVNIVEKWVSVRVGGK